MNETEKQGVIEACQRAVEQATAMGYSKFPLLEMIQASRWLLDELGDGRYQGYAGDWARLLTKFALKCDTFNLRALGRGFPASAVAVSLYRRDGERDLKVFAEMKDGKL